MSEILLNIKAIASMRDQTIMELSKDCGFTPYRLYQISAKKTDSKLSALELKKLSEVTGVPMEMIKLD